MGHEGVGGILDTLSERHLQLVPQACNYNLQMIASNESLLGCWMADFSSVVAPVNRLDNRMTSSLYVKLVQSTCFQTVNSFISSPG